MKEDCERPRRLGSVGTVGLSVCPGQPGQGPPAWTRHNRAASPVASPVALLVASPVASLVASPVASLVASLVASPVASLVVSPAASLVDSLVASPVTPVTKPDILAEVERGEVAAGGYGEHRSPHPRATPAGPSQGDWPGKEVKSEEGASPPPGSPRSHGFPGPLRERGCSYCGAAEPEPNPGASNGGLTPPPPHTPFQSRQYRPGEPALECAECGRGFGHKPDLVRHRLAHGGDRGYACGRCGMGFPEMVRLGAAGSPCRPAPCAGRSPALSEVVTAAAAPRKERKELSLPEKVRVLEMLEGPKVSQSELAKRFGVSQQICRIIKNKERILSEWHRHGAAERKRKREGKDAALEATLLRWVEGARAADLPVSSSLLQLKAKHPRRGAGPARAEPSGGWLARVGARHSLAFRKPLVEKGDAEQPAAERWAGVVLPGLLCTYAPSEIYTCGESAVLLPTGLPGEGESAGDRLTLLLCVNADGSDKTPLWVVGESPQPRCLRGINVAQMPWSYRGGGGGVTAALFAEWLREFNEGMRQQGKSVVLLLAKHQAHPYLQLSNVRMVFIPPTTALAQPLDRGIAGDLRGHYRRRLLRRVPAEHGTGQPTLLDALHMLAQAWGDVHPGLISSCFRAAGVSAEVPTPHPGTRHPQPGAAGAPRADGQGAPWGPGGMRRQMGEEGTVGEPAAVQPCPSEREVWGSLATLRRYLECRATSPDPFRAFYELEDAVHGMAASALAGDTPPKQ
ncbi:LOW QUALITY PROTEIN: tigger transposable element-derived protein 3-like [Porphyrio hochstetteri]